MEQVYSADGSFVILSYLTVVLPTDLPSNDTAIPISNLSDPYEYRPRSPQMENALAAVQAKPMKAEASCGQMLRHGRDQAWQADQNNLICDMRTDRSIARSSDPTDHCGQRSLARGFYISQ
jgi:hypothetical protein